MRLSKKVSEGEQRRSYDTSAHGVEKDGPERLLGDRLPTKPADEDHHRCERPKRRLRDMLEKCVEALAETLKWTQIVWHYATGRCAMLAAQTPKLVAPSIAKRLRSAAERPIDGANVAPAAIRETANDTMLVVETSRNFRDVPRPVTAWLGAGCFINKMFLAAEMVTVGALN